VRNKLQESARKLGDKKVVKLTGYTKAYNSLTNFDYEVKRKLCEFAETCWEEKS